MKRLVPLFLMILASAACQDAVPTVPDDTPMSLSSPAGPPVLAEVGAEAVPLGRAIFFDASLSLNKNESCSFCHDPDFGFSGPNPGINLRGTVYMGSVRSLSGNRRPPSAAYATQSPILHYDAGDDVWVGGNFWDGRATGDLLGNPAADQSLGPFLNPVEQALPDEICVIYQIAEGSYADLWVEVWGTDLRDLPFPDRLDKLCKKSDPITYSTELRTDVLDAFHNVGRSIQAFESSSEVNAFTSKFDAVMAGTAEFTAEEEMGWEVFNGDGQCNLCHISEGDHPLFTDYTYDNLGVPANPLNPVYQVDPDFIDLGIGAYLESQGISGADAVMGAVKVPTLRNVAKVSGGAPKAFSHNGVFKSLEQIVHFYNTRDVLDPCPGEVSPTVAGLARMGYEPACWPAPEVAENVNRDELGNLGLTLQQERALVAFMETLSDGWRGGS
jgi:cytochrome c peroxidase